MNKEQAAEYLGFSVKNLQRLMTEKKIQFTYIKGKNGQQADFDQAELDRYKAEQEKQNNIISPSIAVGDNLSTALSSHSSKGSSMVINTSEFKTILEKLVDGLNQHNKQLNTIPIDQLSFKMMLTLDEATLLSGAPLGIIKKAIKKGGLKGIKLGRVWRVRREDLETWVKGL